MIVSCGQMQAMTLAESAGVWQVVERLANQAAEAGADLLVLPEATYPAYWLKSATRYMQTDIERTPVVLDRFSKYAERHGLWLVVGFVEESGGRLYNSAAVIDRGGAVVGIARKSFLWDCDNRWFSPAEKLSVFDTEFGRMGVLICADARAPEIAATLAAQGAQFMILPTAWVNASKERRVYRNIHPDFLIRARAMEFGVPFACASKSGREGDFLEYVGQSRIVSAEGRVLAQAEAEGEHLITAEMTPHDSKPPNIDAATLKRVLSPEPPYRAATLGGRCTIQLRADADGIFSTLQSAGARVAKVAASELATFPPLRCHALSGAQVVVAKGRVADEVMARARAAENRVYVIVASDSAQLVVDPDGAIIRREADGSQALELDLARSDIKKFTPATDLWEQRHVASYRLGEQVASCPASL
ncbi:MAG TPA: nitrilase-related carbon-nitrogen hydrolase [Phycisphaerae bacterium]|nr:nitrilase-related carbon-nitrogen hydrolase [Phycisphaerae bacterium]